MKTALLQFSSSLVLTLGGLVPALAVAQVAPPAQTYMLSANGYSGLGLVPSASVLPTGWGTAAMDNTLPGAVNTQGLSTQVGFGLAPGLELVGRLAANDGKCNMFRSGACPPDMVRDFSAGLKWAPELPWLKSHGVQLALGVTDVGGAATYFRSYYAVAAKEVAPQLDLSLGLAHGSNATAYLDGPMAAITWRMTPGASLSVQRVGDSTTAHLGVVAGIPYTAAKLTVGLHQHLGGPQRTEKSWFGLGISLPIDTVYKASTTGRSGQGRVARKVSPVGPEQLSALLARQGFVDPQIGHTDDGQVVVQIENTAYAWNMADAAGVSLGALASALGTSDQPFALVLTTRGVPQLQMRGRTGCLRAWLNREQACESLTINGFNQAGQPMYDAGQVRWQRQAARWAVRPELQISPVVTSTIGTEYGAFDMDLGANINLVVPLWRGATLDLNRLEPLDLNTRNFEPGAVYYNSRIQASTTRRLLHQVLSSPDLGTLLRLSVGTTASVWNGAQLESITQSVNGQHKLALSTGRFKHDRLDQERDYALAQYRYAWNEAQTLTTELGYSKFWGGDTGYQLSQRFWHGDTTLTAYMRRTRMSDSQPVVSFAGLTLSIPLTPRQNRGHRYLGVRGTPQWSYTLETKILDTDNRITGGYGQVLNVGEPLATTFNRDRNTSQYYQSQRARMLEAFDTLYQP